MMQLKKNASTKIVFTVLYQLTGSFVAIDATTYLHIKNDDGFEIYLRKECAAFLMIAAFRLYLRGPCTKVLLSSPLCPGPGRRSSMVLFQTVCAQAHKPMLLLVEMLHHQQLPRDSLLKVVLRASYYTDKHQERNEKSC
jgi:hypothetical protein